MKQGWEIKKLGDVVDFQRGLTYSKNDEVDISSNIVLRSNNVDLKTNRLDFTELKYINPKIAIPENKKVKKNSLIICTANGSKRHLGKVAIIDDDYDYAFGGFMGLITPKRNLNSVFLFYLLISDAYKKFIGALSDGANINNLKFSMLSEFEVPVPPLSEQQHIVAVLDKVFATIAKAKTNAEKNLKNAKELFEGYLQGVFENNQEGWEQKPLSDLCTVKHGFAFEGKYFSNDGEFILLTPGNFYESGGYRVRGDKQKFYTGEVPHDYILKKDDLLVVMTEQAAGLLGSPLLVPESNKFLHNQRLGLIVPKKGVPWMNEFFFHVFNTREVRRVLHATGTGVKVRHTSPTKIGDVVVCVPSSIRVQNEIVITLSRLADETKKLEVIYQTKINEFDELKKSILQRAFKGELTKAEVVST